MEFKQSVKEALAYYVYALVDPRDHKIFYIGKGKDNRVFQHAAATIDEIEQGLKLETIKDIISEGKQVEYYILRHNLDEKEAYLVESAIIDMLTYYNISVPLNRNQLNDYSNSYLKRMIKFFDIVT